MEVNPYRVLSLNAGHVFVRFPKKKKVMRRFRAHGFDWCSTSILLEGHEDARLQFHRWVRCSRKHIAVVGASLVVLREAGVVKPQAPSAILVPADEVVAMAKDYNARNPKRRVVDLDVLPDAEGEAIVLEGAPLINDNQEGVAKKAKLDTSAKGLEQAPKFCAGSEVFLVTPPDNDDDDDWMHIGAIMDVDPISFVDMPVASSVGFYALVETSTWIALNSVANDAKLEYPYVVERIVSSPLTTFILLPPMAAGVVSLVVNETSYRITVLSEKITDLVKGEMMQ